MSDKIRGEQEDVKIINTTPGVVLILKTTNYDPLFTIVAKKNCALAIQWLKPNRTGRKNYV